jgi:hypothetical protein
MPAPTQGKFQNIFSSPSKKIKTPDTQARQKSTRQMTQTDDIKMVVTHDRQERQPITRVWQKWRFSAPQTHLWLIKHWFSASTFVVKIATFAKPENVVCKFTERHLPK